MNQACYQGVHLRRWLPVGVAACCVICLGQPLAMFLTVHNVRERLGSAEVQVRGCCCSWIFTQRNLHNKEKQ